MGPILELEIRLLERVYLGLYLAGFLESRGVPEGGSIKQQPLSHVGLFLPSLSSLTNLERDKIRDG